MIRLRESADVTLLPHERMSQDSTVPGRGCGHPVARWLAHIHLFSNSHDDISAKYSDHRLHHQSCNRAPRPIFPPRFSLRVLSKVRPVRCCILDED